MTNKYITGRFHLIASDINEDLSLSYELKDGNYIGIIGETVYAVGFNDKYIIAKQHPYNNKEIINYFILPILVKDELWIEKGLIGPLTIEEFRVMKKKLQISDNVNFSIEIDELK